MLIPLTRAQFKTLYSLSKKLQKEESINGFSDKAESLMDRIANYCICNNISVETYKKYFD